MGAVVVTSQKQPAGSSGDRTPDTVEWLDFTRQQEIRCMKDHYEIQIRTLQDTHKKEKEALKQVNKKLENDIRAQEIINTELRNSYATTVEAEADLRTELQQVKLTMKKLQEDKDTEIIEIRSEKINLMERLRELRDFVRSLKMKNNNLKKDHEERMKIQKQLEEELQTSRVINNDLQKKYETVVETEVKLRKELARVKLDNDHQNKNWESKMKNCEKEKEILVIRNHELQKNVVVTEIKYTGEKRILMEQLKEQSDFVQSLKMTNNNLKKDREERKKIQKQLEEELQTYRVINNDLQKKYESVVETEVKLRKELARVKLDNDNQNKNWESRMKNCEEEKEILVIRNHELQKNVVVTEIKHTREKIILMEQLKEQSDFVRSMKMTNREERTEIQKELQTLRAINYELQKKYETVKGTEVNLRKDLELVKYAYDDLNNYWESKVKDCEEEKKILAIRNQKLQKELEAIKTNAPLQNLQLDGCNSQTQQSRHRGIDTADDEKVSLNNFHLIRKLGEGAFGTVVLAKGNLRGGPEQLCAIKALKKRGITSSNICEIMAEKEALMLTSGHPFITTLHSCFQNSDHIFFVMEYVSGGDLQEQLNELQVFCERRTKFYAAEITLAVQFLHQHGILHRDLKLENVLVGSDGHCKIADFGLSKLGLFRHCKTRTQCGTPVYMAPEIVKNLPYGQGVDWWAVGVMIFVMMTGHLPFDYDEEAAWDDDNSQDELEKKIINDEVEFPLDMSLDAMLIVMELLKKDPKERLGSSGSDDTVRQHPFFKGIDWQALQEKRAKPPTKKVAKKPEQDNQTFSKVLKDGNTQCINQDLFQGFSYINYGVK
jgi:serine/threonine protein kinase